MSICPSNNPKTNTDVSEFTVTYCEPKLKPKQLSAQHRKKLLIKVRPENMKRKVIAQRKALSKAERSRMK